MMVSLETLLIALNRHHMKFPFTGPLLGRSAQARR